jgi:hypothetical protein
MKTTARLLFLACVVATGPTLALAESASPSSAMSSGTLHVPDAERRSPDQTWLTFPEWFLVFSPSDYADSLVANRPASEFPFLEHVREFWNGYGRVNDAVRDRYPFNSEYHAMIAVIGVSTTVEYGLKGVYETLIGRLSELTSAPNATPEDRLATEVAQDYVDFVRERPWYEFDFNAPLLRLWRDTPAVGTDMLRKWERRYMLTSEWAAKSMYAGALSWATRSAYGVAKTTTYVVVERAGKQELLELPRYQAFTDAALTLARDGAIFREIAGNSGIILVSVVVPQSREHEQGINVMIRQNVISHPGHERRVLEVPVPLLSEVLLRHESAGDRIEHVFDY